MDLSFFVVEDVFLPPLPVFLIFFFLSVFLSLFSSEPEPPIPAKSPDPVAIQSSVLCAGIPVALNVPPTYAFPAKVEIDPFFLIADHWAAEITTSFFLRDWKCVPPGISYT